MNCRKYHLRWAHRAGGKRSSSIIEPVYERRMRFPKYINLGGPGVTERANRQTFIRPCLQFSLSRELRGGASIMPFAQFLDLAAKTLGSNRLSARDSRWIRT